MRDCIFLVADTNMQAAFEGFLSRVGFHQSLGCGFFDFDPGQDIKVASGDNDPGLYVRGHELLRPFQSSHRHAVVVLDVQWDGSPGAETIKQHLTERICATGWKPGAFQVIVIDPELENWIWQQNELVARGLGFDNANALITDIDIQQAWPDDASKPTRPKETLEAVLEKKRIPRSSAIYKKITARVSVRRCQDGAFQELVEILRTWFPNEGAQ